MEAAINANTSLSECERYLLLVATYWHDYVYDPKSDKNEENSILALIEYIDSERLDFPESYLNKVSDLIMATKHHKLGNDILTNTFILADMGILVDPTFNDLLVWENAIFKEYQHVPINTYIEHRVKFLQSICAQDGFLFQYGLRPQPLLEQLIEYVKNKTYRIGIYAGSFNPFHVGHLDIVHQADRLFDKVIIARGVNTSKSNAVRGMPSRLPNEIIEYSLLVTNLLKNIPNNVEYTLIRGIRNNADLHDETSYKHWVTEIDPTAKFVYFFPSDALVHVSSSAIREIEKFDTNLASKYMVQ
jgi:pantetheine-phosphate adenylyltransferase